MSRLVVEDSCEAAWLSASAIILREGAINNLLVSIRKPWPFDRHVLERFNPKLLDESIRASARDVANTIFPTKYADRGWRRDQIYKRYLAVNARGQRLRPSWGTYFERMICFPPTCVNRLEEIIEGLRGWQGHHRAAFTMHLSAQTVDTLRPRGAPCLQYLQFSDRDDGLHLTVVVRNHDYFEKALGNLAGLSHLLRFVAHAASRRIGSITCHSIHAYSSKPKSLLRRLRNL